MSKTSEDVQQMIAQADKDKNGSIELNEFIELVASIMGKTNETGVKRENLLLLSLRFFIYF